MLSRVVLLVLLLIFASVSDAESLGTWMMTEMERAFDNARVQTSVRELLLSEAAEHTEGYQLADIDPCYLATLGSHLIPQTVRQAVQGEEEVALVRFGFVRQLVTTLNSQLYERVDGAKLDAQIATLATTLRANIAERYPDFTDDALMGKLEQEWADQLFRLSDSCTVRLLKAPLPEDAFEKLVRTVRYAQTDDDFHAKPLLEERQRATGKSTVAEQQALDALQQIFNRTGATAAQREEMTRVVRGDLSELRKEFHLRAIGDRILFGIVQTEWSRHADHFPGPDHEALQTALERAGVDDAAFDALFGASR